MVKRRTVLQGMGAAGALAPWPALADRPSHLVELIETHRAALAYFNEHCGDSEKVETAYNRAYARRRVPGCLVAPFRVQFELHPDYPHDLEREILHVHERVREFHQLGSPHELNPAFWQGISEAIDASEAHCLDAMRTAIAEEDARQEAFGLAAAKREWHRMADAETAAATGVYFYHPADENEARMRAEYLLAYIARGHDPEPHQIEALLLAGTGKAVL